MNKLMIDITGSLEPEQVPLCPICDEPISTNNDATIATAWDMRVLVHPYCIDFESEKDDEF